MTNKRRALAAVLLIALTGIVALMVPRSHGPGQATHDAACDSPASANSREGPSAGNLETWQVVLNAWVTKTVALESDYKNHPTGAWQYRVCGNKKNGRNPQKLGCPLKRKMGLHTNQILMK